MTATLPPLIKFQPLVAGQPLPGGKVNFYLAGTLTPATVYGADGVTPIGTQLILDANGATDFRLDTSVAYKIDLLDASDTPQLNWPIDDIQSEFGLAKIYTDALRSDLADSADVAKGDALLMTKSALSGAVPRSQHAKNADRVYAKDLGVIGDGVTDDSAAIAAAINTIAAVNGTLVFGAGTYLMGTNGWAGLSFSNKANFEILGEGAVFKLAFAPTQTCPPASATQVAWLQFINCADFTIQGITFNFQDINAVALNFDQCSRYEVFRNRYSATVNTSGYGVFTTRGTGGIIALNSFKTMLYALYTGHTDLNYHEDKLVIVANNATDLNQDFQVGVLKNSTVTGNRMDASLKALCALSALASTGTFSENVTITGNTVSGTAGNAIQSDVYGAISIKGITVSGNSIKGTGGYGIYLLKTEQSSVTGNTIRACNGGITLDSTTDNVPCKDVTISGNTIHADGITPTQHGILLHCRNTTLGMEDIILGSNNVKGYSSTFGISLTSTATGTSRRVALSNNICIGNVRGIDIAVTDMHTDVALTNNICKDNSQYDISCEQHGQRAIGGNNLYTVYNGYQSSLPSIVGGKRVLTHTAAPTTGDWLQGDRCFNSAATVGQPKSWVCTVAGTPGTWVAEGNL